MAKKISTITKLITNKNYRFLLLSGKGFYNWMDDKQYLERMFCAKMGYKLDLDNPVTFNEKLQWLKLYDRKSIYTTMVDKYEVKKYVSDLIGNKYIIPTLGIWNSFDEIDFDGLPEQFVLKCTHDSGGIVVCKDKEQLNKKMARKILESSLKKNYFFLGREWPYKNVKPRIIAEEYMEDEKTAELRDYKFFCFDGEVKALFIATDRLSKEETKFDFFDENFNHLDIENGHPNAEELPSKPECFSEMKILARKLSKGIPHVRVDFYEVNGKVYFGELTFSHWSGIVPFNPRSWDEKFGSWIQLPKEKAGNEEK